MCAHLFWGGGKNHNSPTSFIFDSNPDCLKLKCVVVDEPQLSSLFVSVHFDETFYLAVSKRHKTHNENLCSVSSTTLREYEYYTGAVTLIPVLNKWLSMSLTAKQQFLEISQVGW